MKSLPHFIIALLLVSVICASGLEAKPTVHQLQVLSQVYTVDRKFKSMEGPAGVQSISLLENQPPQLAWITGFRTEIVSEDGKTPASSEFMCHINLDANIGEHARLLGWSKITTPRMFTLSQAQFSADFPSGFGMPVLTNEVFSLATQVLNHNFDNANFKVRHKVTLDYVLDSELKKPMKPLFTTNGFVMRLLEGKDGNYGMSMQSSSSHADASCQPGLNAKAAGEMNYPDGFGRKFSGHWVVPPGHHVDHTNVTKLMNLPFDTTVHYINIHLHPFAESLTLKDLTTGKVIFKSKVRNPKGRIGLEHIQSFSSKRGIKLYKDHEYDMISVYNNDSGVDQDSMATMFMYLLDKEFKKPDLTNLPKPPTAYQLPPPTHAAASPKGDEPRLILRTTGGDMQFILYPDVAPQTVQQIIQLVKAGVYDSLPFFRLERNFVLQVTNVWGRTVPLTDAQRALVHKIPGEFSETLHQRGILSMARETNDINSNETSFSILLADAPHLDRAYTVFGKLEKGWDVLINLEGTPRDERNTPKVQIQIVKAEVVTDKKKLSTLRLVGPKNIPK